MEKWKTNVWESIDHYMGIQQAFTKMIGSTSIYGKSLLFIVWLILHINSLPLFHLGIQETFYIPWTSITIFVFPNSGRCGDETLWAIKFPLVKYMWCSLNSKRWPKWQSQILGSHVGGHKCLLGIPFTMQRKNGKILRCQPCNIWIVLVVLVFRKICFDNLVFGPLDRLIREIKCRSQARDLFKFGAKSCIN